MYSTLGLVDDELTRAGVRLCVDSSDSFQFDGCNCDDHWEVYADDVAYRVTDLDAGLRAECIVRHYGAVSLMLMRGKA